MISARRIPTARGPRAERVLSVLEASLRHNVPHASVCGGKARCSTCRIRVVGDPRALPAPSAGARPSCWNASAPSADPAIRLACQLRPPIGHRASSWSSRHSSTAALMRRSARIRSARSATSSACSSTCAGRASMAEKRLPFDTMFLINRLVSPPWRGPSRTPAAGRTSSSATACSRCSAWGRGPRLSRAARRSTPSAVIAANVEELNGALGERAARADPLRDRRQRRRSRHRRHQLRQQRRVHRARRPGERRGGGRRT